MCNIANLTPKNDSLRDFSPVKRPNLGLISSSPTNTCHESQKVSPKKKKQPFPPQKEAKNSYVFGGAVFGGHDFTKPSITPSPRSPYVSPRLKDFPWHLPATFGHSQIWGCFLFLRGGRGEGGDGFSGVFMIYDELDELNFTQKTWKEASAEMLVFNRDFDGDGKWNEWDVSETCWINC